MSTDTIFLLFLLVGFVIVIYNLLVISDTLSGISLQGVYLEEINRKLDEVNKSPSSDLKSLKGSNYVDLTTIGEYLEKINRKLDDVENAVNHLDKETLALD